MDNLHEVYTNIKMEYKDKTMENCESFFIIWYFLNILLHCIKQTFESLLFLERLILSFRSREFSF